MKPNDRIERMGEYQLTVLGGRAVLLHVPTGAMVEWWPVDDAGVRGGVAAAASAIRTLAGIPSSYQDP